MYALLKHLSDGRFHSGEQLATEFSCSRSAIWKTLKQVKEIPGITVDAVSGRGYRLRRPLELLEQHRIIESLSADQAAILNDCHVMQTVESTNELAAKAVLHTGHSEAWFAEHQTGGRGRRGRAWVSSFGQNIYFSLATKYELPINQLSGLSIAMGAALADLLAQHGLSGHGLKWPNDLLWGDKKIAGILLEASGETDGPATAIIGVGINLHLDEEARQAIDQPVACLSQAGLNVDRNVLAADLLSTTLNVCEQYQAEGLAPFLNTWRKHDLYQNTLVKLITPSQTFEGLSQGLANDGGICLLVDNNTKTFYAGEVSLRAKMPE